MRVRRRADSHLLDRLARSTAELLAIEADLSKRKVGLVILFMGCERLDTRNPTSKLMLSATMGRAAIAKHLGIARSTVYRLLDITTTSSARN